MKTAAWLCVLALLFFPIAIAVAQAQTHPPAQTTPPYTPSLPQTPITVTPVEPKVTTSLIDNAWPILKQGYQGVVRSCLSLLPIAVNTLMSGGLIVGGISIVSSLFATGVTALNTVGTLCVAALQAIGFTIEGIVGLTAIGGIISGVMSLVSLCLNVLNFAYTSGVAGIAVVALLLVVLSFVGLAVLGGAILVVALIEVALFIMVLGVLAVNLFTLGLLAIISGAIIAVISFFAGIGFLVIGILSLIAKLVTSLMNTVSAPTSIFTMIPSWIGTLCINLPGAVLPAISSFCGAGFSCFSAVTWIIWWIPFITSLPIIAVILVLAFIVTIIAAIIGALIVGVIGAIAGAIIGAIVGAGVGIILGIIGVLVGVAGGWIIGFIIGGLLLLGGFLIFILGALLLSIPFLAVILGVIGAVIFFVGIFAMALLPIILAILGTLILPALGFILSIGGGILLLGIIGAIAGAIAGALLFGIITAIIVGIIALIISIITFFVSIILFPLFGVLVNALIFPLTSLFISFIASACISLVDFGSIIVDAITGFAGLIITGITLMLLRVGIDLMQTTLISEIVTVLVLFLQKLQEISFLTKMAAYPIEVCVGITMLCAAVGMFLLNILLYPFNFVWQFVDMCLKGCYGVVCKPFIRPLGWE